MASSSTHQDPDAQPSKGQDSFSILEEALEDLSAKSTLDMFRMFFDIKREVWGRFRDRLHRHVQTNYSWAIMQRDVKQRRECAGKFLAEVGHEYWGTPENRQKHLMEERVKKGDVCIYPDHKKPLTEALVKLLEKNAKDRRDSTAQNVSSSHEETAPPSDTTTTGTEAAPAATSTSISTSQNTPAASPAIKKSASPETVRPALRSQDQSLLSPFRSRERIQAPRPAARGRFSLDAYSTVNPYRQDISDVSGQRTIAGQHQLATYFLIRCTDDDDQQEPVCVPFDIFPNADRFLDRMGDEVTECDEVWDQLSSEMPELYRRYAISAVVRLRWSNVSFVIRRGTDDLQALVNRVGCAWRAKDQGKLDTFEFAIEVTLNMDLTLKK